MYNMYNTGEPFQEIMYKYVHRMARLVEEIFTKVSKFHCLRGHRRDNKHEGLMSSPIYLGEAHLQLLAARWL